jgi:hypothetical protein
MDQLGPRVRRPPLAADALGDGHQTAIDTQIVLRHTPSGKPLLKATSDVFAGRMPEPVNCANRAADVLHNEASYAVVDYF